MEYLISGANKDSGIDQVLIVTAPDEAIAEAEAREHGMLVTSVQPYIWKMLRSRATLLRVLATICCCFGLPGLIIPLVGGSLLGLALMFWIVNLHVTSQAEIIRLLSERK